MAYEYSNENSVVPKSKETVYLGLRENAGYVFTSD